MELAYHLLSSPFPSLYRYLWYDLKNLVCTCTTDCIPPQIMPVCITVGIIYDVFLPLIVFNGGGWGLCCRSGIHLVCILPIKKQVNQFHIVEESNVYSCFPVGRTHPVVSSGREQGAMLRDLHRFLPCSSGVLSFPHRSTFPYCSPPFHPMKKLGTEEYR